MTTKNKMLQILASYLLGFIVGYILYIKSFLVTEQIAIYMVLRIISATIIFFKNRYIKILAIPGIIGIGFLILIAFLPLYNQNLNDSNFHLTQKVEYIFIGNAKNVEIKEVSEYGEQKINPTETNQKLFFSDNNQRTLFFNEKINTPNETNRFIIEFPDNTIYIAYPGSETKIEKRGDNYTITKNIGNIEYYQPNPNNKVKIITNNSQEQKNKSDFSLGYIIDNYEKAKTKYTTNQAGGTIVEQPIYQKFSKKILDIAYYIRPKIYQENLENYKQYKDFFKREDNETNFKMDENWLDLILQQAKKGRKETQILK